MKGEWQLPVKDSILDDKGYIISNRSKLHYFVNGDSLCKRYWQMPDFFKTTDINESEIKTHPEYYCKKCLERYKKCI